MLPLHGLQRWLLHTSQGRAENWWLKHMCVKTFIYLHAYLYIDAFNTSYILPYIHTITVSLSVCLSACPAAVSFPLSVYSSPVIMQRE